MHGCPEVQYRTTMQDSKVAVRTWLHRIKQLVVNFNVCKGERATGQIIRAATLLAPIYYLLCSQRLRLEPPG